MSSLARNATASATDQSGETGHAIGVPLRDYIPYITHAMREQNVSVRKLALKTGIRRSRLTELLKLDQEPESRQSMTLVELQTVLHVLGIEFMQAVLGVEALRDLDLLRDNRFSTMFAMVSEVVKGLPIMLVQALNEVEGMDGTEIRREWAVPLREGVVDRVVREVSKTIARRGNFDVFSDRDN